MQEKLEKYEETHVKPLGFTPPFLKNDVPKKLVIVGEKIKTPVKGWEGFAVNMNGIYVRAKNFSELRYDINRATIERYGSNIVKGVPTEIFSYFDIMPYWTKNYMLIKALVANILDLVHLGFRLFSFEINNAIIIRSPLHNSKFDVHDMILDTVYSLTDKYKKSDSSDLYVKVTLNMLDYNIQIRSIPDPKRPENRPKKKILSFNIIEVKTGRLVHTSTDGFIIDQLPLRDIGLIN